MTRLRYLTWSSIVGLILTLVSEKVAIEKFGKTYGSSYIYDTKWYEQQIDHFSFGNTSTFKQRYLVNATFWEPENKEKNNDKDGGPIFFYTGNEGDIEAFAQNTGFMWDIAEEFSAMVVFAEHRYYGKSIPFGDASIKPGNPTLTGYLSSEQALADYARLVLHIKETTAGASSSPVIAFGGSYGGMLSAWFRIKYPHICNGAIAASAPVAQFTTNCDAFARIVTTDYSNVDKTSGETARGEIGKSWNSINKLGSTKEGQAWLKNKFKLCKKFNTTEDVNMLKGYLTDLWTDVAMMDYPYPTSFLKPLPGNPVEFISKRIAAMPNATTIEKKGNKTDEEKLNIRRIVAGAEVYYNFTGKAACLDLEDQDQIGADMWDYQACTEMIMPICYKGDTSDMFEKQDWNKTAWLINLGKYCQSKWKVTPRKNMADINYGSKKLQAASNIVFSNGLRDPWSSGGVLKRESDSVVAVIIPEGAHHLDLRGANPLDPKSVNDARDVHKANIKKWINQASVKEDSVEVVQARLDIKAMDNVKIEILP